ncbi:uncharacterized protein BXZ73DRAFT_92501 [Epithele typhae]|uniref:uncharacterized protein n=1 Tax=Epithele typhae TaxID=378194 RepID=UPI0020085915|nr:uncharacterized protein BXZ73DRAFT_92501 [Epithele typhae]KAH9916403.1 hypothetical protein BXZ73DRAFT_92501 [Epithele typhae]
MSKTLPCRLSTPRRTSRPAWIVLLLSPPLLPFLLPLTLARAGGVNTTVDDVASQIGTWHDGTHIIPTVDSDDLPSSTSSTAKATQTTAKTGDDDGDDGKKGDDDNDGDSRKRRRGRVARKRRGVASRADTDSSPTSNPFFTPNFDSDDAGFVDTLVTAAFNFTGSAVYVYAIIPLANAQTNSTPTFMNLTFLVDSHTAGTYQHAGSPNATGFQPTTLIFSHTGMAEGAHSLTMQVEPDSVLLLDSIVYTAGAASDGDGSTPPSTSKAHSVATFAGAVGGSVGLLAVLALSVTISIYRRRMRARRRERRNRRRQHRASDPDWDGESFHTDASEDAPPMQGPQPFVPRYFPGTVVPAPPPPYSPPADATTALLSSTSPPWGTSGLPGPGEDTSYADVPPPTPPPPEDGADDYYYAPPSFPTAISSPIPAILAGYSPVATNPVSTSPVPRQANGSSRGVYDTGARPRSDSDAQSQWSGYSDRPPSFTSQAPSLIAISPDESQTGITASSAAAPTTADGSSAGDRVSIRSSRSTRSR